MLNSAAAPALTLTLPGNLVEANQRKAIGTAIWLLLWLERARSGPSGEAAGDKPLDCAAVGADLGCDERSVRRMIGRLSKCGRVTVEHRRAGPVVRILNRVAGCLEDRVAGCGLRVPGQESRTEIAAAGPGVAISRTEVAAADERERVAGPNSRTEMAAAAPGLATSRTKMSVAGWAAIDSRSEMTMGEAAGTESRTEMSAERPPGAAPRTEMSAAGGLADINAGAHHKERARASTDSSLSKNLVSNRSARARGPIAERQPPGRETAAADGGLVAAANWSGPIEEWISAERAWFLEQLAARAPAHDAKLPDLVMIKARERDPAIGYLELTALLIVVKPENYPVRGHGFWPVAVANMVGGAVHGALRAAKQQGYSRMAMEGHGNPRVSRALAAVAEFMADQAVAARSAEVAS